MMSLCTCASLHAMRMAKSSMLWSHMRMFCDSVSSKSTMFWSTTAMELVSSSLEMLSMGRPSKSISPLQGL